MSDEKKLLALLCSSAACDGYQLWITGTCCPGVNNKKREKNEIGEHSIDPCSCVIVFALRMASSPIDPRERERDCLDTGTLQFWF